MVIALRPDIDTIRDWLADVPDPEIPAVSVLDLGIVRDIKWLEDVLHVTITPTYSGCPATSVIGKDIQSALERQGIARVEIAQQIAPPWTTDWISPAGRQKLAAYGIAPPQASGTPDACPRCHSAEVERISQFGSTPCKAQWRCLSCLEPFDYFKCLR